MSHLHWHRGEIAPLKQEIVNLKSQKPEPVDKLPGEAEKILMFFTKYTDVTADQIAHHLSIELTRTEHWLDVLEEKNMVYAPLSMMSPTTYSINSEGRKYLVNKNMI